MISATDLASAALNRDALQLRSLVQDLVRSSQRLADLPMPNTQNSQLLAVAAGIVELLAVRTGQPAPNWTASIGAAAEPYFLVAAAERLPSLRQLCQDESPEPLKRRQLFAPPNFLTWA